ncbi:MAG: cytidine deaminase [Bacteroidales bacterium]|nr:cytidine deaminase [Bacteroidales bacterium]
MTNKEIKIEYYEYDSINGLSPEETNLANAAIEATAQSYAPYSNFNVGAAVMYEDGEIIKGSNQENAAFPSGLCAERTALFYAGSSRPGVPIKALAIAAGQNGVLCKSPVTPCGACRQVMAEYQTMSGRPMTILLIGSERVWRFSDVEDLLPLIFDSL